MGTRRGGALPHELRFEVDGKGSVTHLGGGRFVLFCDPGPVTLMCNGHSCAHFTLEEGETLEDVMIQLGASIGEPSIEPPPDSPPPPAVSWVEVEAPEGPMGSLRLFGHFSDLGWRRLGDFAGGDPWRVNLPSRRLTEIAVCSWSHGTWRQHAHCETTIALAAPRVRRVMARIVHPGGAAAEGGWLALRWPGSAMIARDALDIGARDPTRSEVRAVEPPEGWQIHGVGPGAYDVVWIPVLGKAHALLRRGMVVGEQAGTVDLGTLEVLPLLHLSLRVLGPDGRGVGGAVIRVTAADMQLALRTDASGRLESPTRDPVAIEVTAEAAGYALRSTVVGTEEIQHLVVLVLEPE